MCPFVLLYRIKAMAYKNLLQRCLLVWAILLWHVMPVQAELVIDQVGRQINIPDNPQRIISLMPSITETIFDLGAGDRVKGVTLFSKEPIEAAELPKVGSYVHLDLEKIVSLRPDLCLATRDGNPKHIVDKLSDLGIAVFTIDPRNMQEIMDSIMILGKIVQAEARAAIIVTQMQTKIDRVSKRIAAMKTHPRVFFQIDASPIISAGSKTFIDQLIQQAGGINLAAGAAAYPRYSWEDILVMQPEIVIIASMAGGYSDDDLKEKWLKWPQIPAVRDKKIHVVDASLFDRPTARLADGLEMLVDIFYPSVN